MKCSRGDLRLLHEMVHICINRFSAGHGYYRANHGTWIRLDFYGLDPVGAFANLLERNFHCFVFFNSAVLTDPSVYVKNTKNST